MEYIISVDQLHKVSLGTVGTLTKLTYSEAVALVTQLAHSKGVQNPIGCLEIHFKPGSHVLGLSESVYAPDEYEWADFQATVGMCESDPILHVVDGDKYKCMI